MPPSVANATSTIHRTPSLNRGKGARAQSVEPRQSTEKFPDFEPSDFQAGFASPAPRRSSVYGNGAALGADRWAPRRESSARGVRFAGVVDQSGPPQGRGHYRQQSITDAIRNIRTRGGSVSQNAHEIAEALRAPVSPKLVILCVLWYTTSALTNTSAKAILNAYKKPATLTIVQFAFVSIFCILSALIASAFPAIRRAVPALRHGIRYPTRDVIRATLPLALFSIGGHLLSSNATAKIPVSLVHTIKGLSPLFTVLAYRFIYDIRYPTATYISLIPLTAGVMLACAGKQILGGQLVGIIYSLIATIIFVTQNIFSKRLFNEAARLEAEGGVVQSKRLDKLNLLCYCSGIAFVITFPYWLWTEGFGIIGDFLKDGSLDLVEGPKSMDHGRLFVEFVFNGVTHFGQNILAFVLLSMVSPVSYSVASLLKRVFVILVTLLWFRNPTTSVQGVGIGLTFLGLYMYDRSNESNKADRKARMMTEQSAGQNVPLLPLNTANGNSKSNGHAMYDSPATMSAGLSSSSAPHVYTNGYDLPNPEDTKKSDDNNNNNNNNTNSTNGNRNGAGGRIRGQSNAAWRPPGTRQEDTWRFGEKPIGVA